MAVLPSVTPCDHSKRQPTKVTFAKLLAGNNKKIRDKGLKKLNAWFSVVSKTNYVVTEDDFMTIWTGLYYSMWMSDLPLVQEDLAESISMLIHSLKGNTDAALLFIKCFYVTMGRAWSSIDQHRMDKFSMLVRRFLRQSLDFLRREDWNLALTNSLLAIFKEHVLGEKVTLGFKLHFIEIFLEELAKISAGTLNNDVLMTILELFARTAALTGDGRVRMQCETFFRQLIKQTDAALEYNEKFEAWKRAGFPGGNPNLMVLDKSEEDRSTEEESPKESEMEEDEPTALDPRAGSVHASLPQLELPALRISKMMKRLVALPQVSIRGKRLMLTLHRRFKTLHKGKYPFADGKIFSNEKTNLKKMIANSVKKEIKEEMTRKNKRKEAKLAKKKKAQNSVCSPKVSVRKLDKKLKKAKSLKDATPKTSKKKLVKTGFVVTKQEVAESATVGARKRKNSEEVEVELPPGWIVEPCEAAQQPPSKKVAFDGDWLVSKGGSAPPSATAPLKTSPVGKRIVADALAETGNVSSKSSPKPILSTPKSSKPEAKENNVDEPQGETEIVIEPKKKSPPKTPAFFSHAVNKVNKSSAKKTPSATPTSMLKEKIVASLNDSKSGRRISFNLAKNMAQETSEYFEQLQRSPQVPFDAGRIPQHSALKAGLPPSPINPFYAVKLGFNKYK